MRGGAILVVEADHAHAELAVLALVETSAEGIHVVRDGTEALAYLLGDRPLPAVVFLAIKLPEVDGFDLLGQIRAADRTRRLPVVMLTSSDAPDDIARAYALGANSYVCKPAELEAYRETVGRVGRYWLDLNERTVQQAGTGERPV